MCVCVHQRCYSKNQFSWSLMRSFKLHQTPGTWPQSFFAGSKRTLLSMCRVRVSTVACCWSEQLIALQLTPGTTPLLPNILVKLIRWTKTILNKIKRFFECLLLHMFSDFHSNPLFIRQIRSCIFSHEFSLETKSMQNTRDSNEMLGIFILFVWADSSPNWPECGSSYCWDILSFYSLQSCVL